MSLPRYPEYKDSGVTWLGQMPSHWSLQRYKQVFVEREERSEEGAETLLSVSAYTGVSPRSEIIEDGDHLSRAESLEGYKVCYPDDLVMNIMLAWNRGLGFSAYHGIVSPAYSVFKPQGDNNPRFLDYMVRSDQVTLYYKAFSAGVIESRLRLYPDTFGSLYCALPPHEEQSAIAAFLDRETAKIDALIAEQEKLIALLAEKRQATISHAVTRGLNPDAPMKDSGVAWLGEVPAHWDAVPLRWHSQCKSGDGISSTDIESFAEPGHETPAIGGNGRMGFTFSGNIDRSVLAIGRVGALCGNVHVVHPPAWISDNALILTPSNAFLLDYLAHSLRSRNLNEIASKTAQPLITGTQVADQRVPLPPMNEQCSIVEFIRNEIGKLDALSTEADSAIALLKERRSTLIAAAVTGQIDVRGTLPEVA